MIEFLSRMAEILSLGMEIAEREERRPCRRGSEGANSAHARGAQRDERSDDASQNACRVVRTGVRAAVLGGNFASTTILLKATDNDFLQVEAAAGPDAERARGPDCRLMPRVRKGGVKWVRVP